MDLPARSPQGPLPLTSAEAKLLGFLAFLALLGAANLGLQAWSGSGEEAWAWRPAPQRAALPAPPRGDRAWSRLDPALNVNRAPARELRWVPGVGPETAARIVQYREAHGPFQSLAGLQAVKGLGPKKLARMAPYLILGAPAKGTP